MSKNSQRNANFKALVSAIEKDLNIGVKTPIDATAWFLGPKAENRKALLEFVAMAAESQITTREKYMPEDPPIFDEEWEKSDKHQESIGIIREQLGRLLDQLRGSIPLASYRNQSHMYWDLTLPGTVGYFAAMLYNQNNVAVEASPVTTALEIQVGKDLCQMLGFGLLATNIDYSIKPWGHITCDGSIANGESMWAARNLKFLPVALASAIATEPDLEAAKSVTVETCKGDRELLIKLTKWELLNLPIDEVIGLVPWIAQESRIEEVIIQKAVDQYSVQNMGLVEFQRFYLDTDTQATPVVLVPGTAHYSWPKTAALIGLGTNAVKPIKLDLDGHMRMDDLERKLDQCLNEGRPVLQVVAVMGSTAEGAVDPLADIVRIRAEYQRKGLNFVIHVDGAWGGYFTSMLRHLFGDDQAQIIDNFPELYINDYFEEHFTAIAHADSVTLDPHKSGFIPYPAGSLCYRNGAMRDLIAYTAEVVTHGDADMTVGPYGIEGSKPGAAAASVYLSHKVIPLNMSGYGRILGRCLFNSKRFYAALVTMDLDANGNSESRFNITALQRLPTEKKGANDDDIRKEKNYLKTHFVSCTTDYLIEKVFGLKQAEKNVDQKKALKLFQAIGSDLSIISYAFNFKTANGDWNTELELMNELNDKVFTALSLQNSKSREIPSVKMFITASAFDPKPYGQPLVDDFGRRAGIDAKIDKPIKFLISTTQNPWLSTATKDFNMIDPLIEILRDTVNQAIGEIINEKQPGSL